MKRQSEPYRTCVGCGAKKHKRELLRIVYDQSLKLVIDPAQIAPGRGAYLCQDPQCAQKAINRKVFGRALRQPINAAPDFLKVFQAGL